MKNYAYVLSTFWSRKPTFKRKKEWENIYIKKKPPELTIDFRIAL